MRKKPPAETTVALLVVAALVVLISVLDGRWWLGPMCAVVAIVTTLVMHAAHLPLGRRD